MNRTIKILVVGCLFGANAAKAQAPDPVITPPGYHQQLDTFRDVDGREHLIGDIEIWNRRREQILEGMREVMGTLPSRDQLPPIQVELSEPTERPGHIRHYVRFNVAADESWTAYLFVPKGIVAGERRPGIIALHPTNPVGKGVPDAQAEAPNRAYGRELADRGYVVIAPDYPSFGDQKEYDFSADSFDSGTLKGIFVHMRALDALSSLDSVDPDRLAAIGHSLGGHNAIFLGVFDPRVKAVVTSCGWCPFHDYYGGNIKGWTSDRYMPRLRDVYALDPGRVPFDFYELVAALAPRGFFTNSPLHDANFDVAGVKKAMPAVERIYHLHGAADRIQAAYPDADHDFPPEARFQSYTFLDRILHHQPVAQSQQ